MNYSILGECNTSLSVKSVLCSFVLILHVSCACFLWTCLSARRRIVNPGRVNNPQTDIFPAIPKPRRANTNALVTFPRYVLHLIGHKNNASTANRISNMAAGNIRHSCEIQNMFFIGTLQVRNKITT
jgi:hypothetical protein